AAQPAAIPAQPAATTAAAVIPSDAPLSQPPATPPPAQGDTYQPASVTTYQTVPYWSEAELAAARRVGPGTPGAPGVHPAGTAAKVYPRTYTRAGGTY